MKPRAAVSRRFLELVGAKKSLKLFINNDLTNTLWSSFSRKPSIYHNQTGKINETKEVEA
jgi:hypothetical protein